jgi:hypothetical protein
MNKLIIKKKEDFEKNKILKDDNNNNNNYYIKEYLLSNFDINKLLNLNSFYQYSQIDIYYGI